LASFSLLFDLSKKSQKAEKCNENLPATTAVFLMVLETTNAQKRFCTFIAFKSCTIVSSLQAITKRHKHTFIVSMRLLVLFQEIS